MTNWKLKVSATIRGSNAKYELLWQPLKRRWLLSKYVPIGRFKVVGGEYERPVPVAHHTDLGPTDIQAALDWASATITLGESP